MIQRSCDRPEPHHGTRHAAAGDQPLPVARDHMGIAVVAGALHVVGGRVDSFHTNSSSHHSYDTTRDRWVAYAPMLTPRHGKGAVVVGDAIYVAGGGPQMGGGVKSAINEAFSIV
jgi:Kelch motif